MDDADSILNTPATRSHSVNHRRDAITHQSRSQVGARLFETPSEIRPRTISVWIEGDLSSLKSRMHVSLSKHATIHLVDLNQSNLLSATASGTDANIHILLCLRKPPTKKNRSQAGFIGNTGYFTDLLRGKRWRCGKYDVAHR